MWPSLSASVQRAIAAILTAIQAMKQRAYAVAIFSRVLYQLSYLGMKLNLCTAREW